MQCKVISSLEKVFHDEEPPAYLRELTLLAGEAGDFQFAFCNDTDGTLTVTVEADIPVRVHSIRDVYAGLAIFEDHGGAVLREGKSGYYPDALLPPMERYDVKKGVWNAVWVEIPSDTAPGSYTVKACVTDGVRSAQASLPVTVFSVPLPAQTLLCTHWFHSDCLSTYYDVPVFSEEYWRITENYVRTAVAHGINLLLTPLFTPPLDTAVGGERPTVQLVDVTKKGYVYTFGFEKLDRWVDMALRCGIRAFEMSHLFTQWGATAAPKIMAQTTDGCRQIFGWDTDAASRGYRSFLTQFAAALIPYLQNKGIADRCWFHTSDEPGLLQYYSYRRAARTMHELFGAFRSFDALGEFRFYKNGLVRTPVPEEGSIERFRGRVESLWTYFCCGQYKNQLPNRFFCMPLSRCRILGVLFYLYDIEGFLQWGFNFWYTRYSLRAVDPYAESDAGGHFPSGDAYQVYPAPDGTAYVSLRLKVFRDALADLQALRLLESLTDRKTVEALLYDCLGGPLSFTSYPLDGAQYETLRRRVNAAINGDCRR